MGPQAASAALAAARTELVAANGRVHDPALRQFCRLVGRGAATRRRAHELRGRRK